MHMLPSEIADVAGDDLLILLAKLRIKLQVHRF